MAKKPGGEEMNQSSGRINIQTRVDNSAGPVVDPFQVPTTLRAATQLPAPPADLEWSGEFIKSSQLFHSTFTPAVSHWHRALP